MRADQLLVERGLAASRSQAARLIASGLRWLDGAVWRTVGKNGDDIPPTAQLELADTAESRYVSRGGLKLEGALAATGLEALGRRCLDVGQSTGGFTDALLARGAAEVVGVDVGHGQLHPKLAGDARVVAIERLNARALTRTGLDDTLVSRGRAAVGAGFDLVVGDLSFISLTLVLPAIAPLLSPSGHLLMLVKPQFELTREQIGKGGVVRDTALYADVEQRLRGACDANGLVAVRWLPSPIEGGDGNREFFVLAQSAPAH